LSSSTASSAAPAGGNQPGQSGTSQDGARGALSYKERSCLSKKRYWSRVDALVMAARCVERRNPGPLGAYRCGNCAGWHLTRQV
jgi:hypothetical protein